MPRIPSLVVRALAPLLLLAAGAPSSASAVSSIDLLTQASAEIDGPSAAARFGTAVGGSGDVTGDGTRDVLVGAIGAHTTSIVPGRLAALTDLGRTPTAAIPINAANYVTEDVGDVNGDGLDDVAVSVFAESSRRVRAGAVWVIFSSPAGGPVDLNALGARGFRIDGEAEGDNAGQDVAGAGDVNGDGRADLVIGAYRHGSHNGAEAGRTYVVFGKASSSTIDLARLGAGGYTIDGEGPNDWSGFSVANAGDVNGDGRPDQLIGAPHADGLPQKYFDGRAYVVFGKPNTTPVNLETLGGSGYEMRGIRSGDELGWSVDRAGDVNGDGRPDQLIGAPGAQYYGGIRGVAYVVFGQSGTSPVDLQTSTNFYRIGAAMPDDFSHMLVANLGDVTGDGRPDQAIGGRDADNGGRRDSGSVWVVRGKASTSDVDLGTFTNGYRIDGPTGGAHAGYAIAGPGNVHGDGKRDVLLGAPYVQANGRRDSGAAYVVDGGAVPTPAAIGPVHVEAPRPPARVQAAATRGRITYRTTRPVRVMMRVFRIAPGRRVLRKASPDRRAVTCRAPGSGRVKARFACSRLLPVGTLSATHTKAGAQRVAFDGRDRGKRLQAGRYVLVATAKDGTGRVHGPTRARFRIR